MADREPMKRQQSSREAGEHPSTALGEPGLPPAEHARGCEEPGRAVSEILEALDGVEGYAYRALVHALEELSPWASERIAAALEDAAAKARAGAACALRSHETHREAARAAVLRLLGDPNAEVRWAASGAFNPSRHAGQWRPLDEPSPSSQEAAPQLAALLNDADYATRANAALALCAIGSPPPEVVPVLIEVAIADQSSHYSDPFRAVGTAALPALFERLRSAVDAEGAERLHKAIGDAAHSDSGALFELFHAADAFDRVEIAAATARSEAPECAAFLVEALRSPDDEVREPAAEGIARGHGVFGVARAEGGVDALCRAVVGDPNVFVRSAVARSLGVREWSFSAEARLRFADALAQAMQDQSEAVREEAVWAYAAFKDRNLEYLRECDPNERIRIAIGRYLSR